MTDESLARPNVRTKDSVGYLYVLTNESMPGLVKIGYTTRDPRARALELFNQATGVPTPFHVVFAVFCSEPAKAEISVFEDLETYRVSGNREFFRVDENEAIVRVVDVALSYSTQTDFEVKPSGFIVDEVDTAYLQHRIEKVLGVELPPTAGAEILFMVTPEEALPAAKRYIEKIACRNKRTNNKESEGEQ